MYRCPENHDSATPDFCSVCGVEIPQGAEAAPAAGTGEGCPDCGTPRDHALQVFCEVCGHNFFTGTQGSRDAGSALPAEAPAAAPSALAVRWDVVVRVDPNLYGKTNADAPLDQPSQTFTLFETENMIGREGTGLRLQVPIRND